MVAEPGHQLKRRGVEPRLLSFPAPLYIYIYKYKTATLAVAEWLFSVI